MKISLVQLNIKWEQKRFNYNRAEEFVDRASRDHCDVIVFPEMFCTGFSMNVNKIAETDNGPTSKKMASLARQYEISIIGGYVEIADSSKGRNVAAVYDKQGNLSVKYMKNHPFSFANEDKYYVPGDKIIIFEINKIPCSIFICYDLRFPEIFRKVAKSVQIIFVIANWPSTRQEHWEALLKARAIENQCFIIGVNRIGRDGNNLKYTGGSHVFDPIGKDLLHGSDKEEYYTVDINPGDVDKTRIKFPFLKDIKYI
ncbi:Amidohydrolase [Candidatus Magnetomoraceae bacterium gMMP-15]